MKSTGYLLLEKSWEYLKIQERETRNQMLSYLLTWHDTDKETFRVSLLKTALSFLTNQAT